MTARVALVTGGSRGIGYGIVQRLLADGFCVAATARKAKELDEARVSLGAPGRVLALAGRSDDPEHRADAVDAVLDRFGGLDLLVNNAGTNPVMGPMVELDLGAARKIVEVNVLACLGWSRELVRARSSAPSGEAASIVNIASVSGDRPSRGIGMYGVSKAALSQLTRQLALELAPHVRVNAVSPALVATEMAAALYVGHEEETAAIYPMERLGTPADIAGAVAFLASPEAAWITGQTLVVDGGLGLTGGGE